MKNPKFSLTVAVLIFIGLASSMAFAEEPARKNYGKGNPFTVEELPAGKLKAGLQALNPQARGKAMKWLHTFTFPEMDAVESLQVDKEGGVYYACAFSCVSCKTGEHDKSVHYENPVEKSGAPEAQSTEPTTEEKSFVPEVAAAAVLISSPPVYNSKPGAPNHMYLDFNGGVITGKAWNTSRGVTSWTAKAYSSDGDLTTFSDAEQTFIRRVWERIAEDYAPFNINITTDVAYDPDTTGGLNNVAWNLFCPRVDANSVNLPHAGSGGVAYVGVFGNSNFASTYQPAFTKAETTESADIAAEAGSHEVGHNMGLSHDTRSNEGYYGGHNATALATSWGPIMGTGYGRNMSQWSKGEYYDSKHASWDGSVYVNNANTNDDLLIISNRTGYRTDDHGGTNATATALTLSGSGGINQTGIIQNTIEVDVLSFATGAGSITINANSFKSDASTWGGNLDINLELYNSAGTLVASHNPAADVTATITTTVAAGTYYIHIKPSAAGNASGTGSPYDSVDSTRGGYTDYGSLGQYTVTGSAILPGVNITELGGTNVTEGGATDTYTIKLGTAPTADVTVSISPNVQVSTSALSVTFTTSNWSIAQTVTVTAVNDTTIEGAHTGVINHATSSADSNFNGIGVASIVVNIADNDNIVLTAPNGGESWMASSTQTITWNSLMGGNVRLELLKNGVLDSTILASTPNDGTHSWTIPTGQLPAADYRVRITSVETPAALDTSLTNFTISAIPSTIASQNFDSASTLPSGWSNTTVSGTASWGISTTKSHSPTRSAFIVGSSVVSSNQLTSASMAIPAGTTDIKFSFYHDYVLEANWDAGVLEFSIDGGAWFDVASVNSGASFASNGYNLGSIPSNYSNPLGGRAGWSGNSGGFVQTVVNLNDTAKYAGKSLQARWITGTDNGNGSAGWYVDTVSLTGVFSTPPTYTVTYNGNSSNGGTVPTDTTTYANNATVTVLGNGTLVRAGYTFDGWNTLADGTGTNYAAAATFSITTNTTLYARWVINSYTISFNSNGGSAVSSIMQNYGTTVTAPVDPTRSGYIFTGWSPTVPTPMPASNTNCTAQWAIGYIVTYSGNASTGGTAPANQIKTHDVNLALATNSGNLVKTGNTFAGWNTTTNGGGTSYAVEAAYATNAALTLYAKWTVNTYTLTYAAGTGGILTGQAIQTVNHGANGTQITAAPNSGYSFVKWSDNVMTASRTDTNVSAGLNVSASFAITVTVPNVIGLAQVTAESNIVTANLAVGTVTTRNHASIPAGSVINQTPSGGSSVAANSVVNLVVSLGPYAQTQYATSDVAASGTVGGTYTNTQASDNSYETITEIELKGNPNSSYSYLEHMWTFDIASSNTLTFNVEAHHSTNTENDDFTFSYSTTGANGIYSNMLTVTKTSDNNAIQTFSMPAGIIGTVHVRVIDTNRVAGMKVLDTLFIDRMYFLSTVNAPTITVPNVVGLAKTIAETNIFDASLVVGTVTTQYHATVPVGIVISQTPVGSTSAAQNSVVDMVVSSGLSYAGWVTRSYAQPFTNTGATANPDGDGFTNLQEFAFGMDPTLSTALSLTFNAGGEVTQSGIPILRFVTSKYHAVFARRKDYVAAGLTYTTEFSADLKEWDPVDSGLGSVLTGAGSSELEAVSIEFPSTVPVQGGGAEQAPKFFRVGVQ